MPVEGNIGLKIDTQHKAVPESVIKWRMDTSDVMELVRKSLSVIGNDKLIDRAMTILTSVINKTTIQGNIKDEERAGDISCQIANDEAEHIGQHYDIYGLNPGDRDIYIDIIGTYIFLGLTRPIQDYERKHTVDQGQERITTHQGIQSLFPTLPGAYPAPSPPKNTLL